MTMRDGQWKYIDRLGSGGFSKPNRIRPKPGGPRGQLFDLQADPGETKNLYLDRPEIVERLQQELKRQQKARRTRPE